MTATTQAAAPPRPGRRGLRYQARVLRVIAATEFKLKYSDSVLGYAWSLLKPLALFSVLYVVFGRFFALDIGFAHYPLFLLIGIVLWTFFVDATTLTMSSIVARGALLRKLAFPHLLVPLSVTLTAALTFCVNLIAIAAFLAWNRIVPRVEWLLLVPLVAELFVFTIAVGLILATLFVRFRDIGQVWELAIQVLFFASPIIYPIGFLPPWAQPVAMLSPFVHAMQQIRAVVLGPHESPEQLLTAADVYGTPLGHLIPLGFAVLLLAAALWLFRRESPWIPERV
jgi:ABC-2 type transport system permease protein